MIKSPVTGESDCEEMDRIPVAVIIEQYQNLCKLDVSEYFNGLEYISIYRCTKTNYRFYYPLDIDGDGEFYEYLMKNYLGYYNPFRWEHGFASAFITNECRLLEIGSGIGYYLKYLQQKNIRSTGLELNEASAAISRNENLDVRTELIQEHALHHKQVYDIVCSFQVLEHINNINEFISSSISCLKPGGLLIIAVPNNNPYIFKHDALHTLNLPPHHMGLWNRDSLKKMGLYFGLETVRIETEPLTQYKDWYVAQRNYYCKAFPLLGKILSLVPRPIYKTVVKLARPMIEGPYVTAVYKKPL